MNDNGNSVVMTESVETVPSAEPVKTRNQKKKTPIWKDILDFILMAAVVMSVCRFVFLFHYIPTRSMEPTIARNSFAVCWRLPYLLNDPTPCYGDVVSFRSEQGEFLIKRVIGLPGDIITFDDGYVYRNGDVLDEEYLAEQGVTKHGNQEKYIVPDGCVFVLGDNREHSADSRYMDNPYIPTNRVISKMLISFPIPLIKDPN